MQITQDLAMTRYNVETYLCRESLQRKGVHTLWNINIPQKLLCDITVKKTFLKFLHFGCKVQH
jgi:hypothetical protein